MPNLHYEDSLSQTLPKLGVLPALMPDFYGHNVLFLNSLAVSPSWELYSVWTAKEKKTQKKGRG